MRLTAIQAQTERKRQARSICCTEKRGRCRRMTPVHGLIRRNLRGCTTVAAIRSTERLTRRPRQDNFLAHGRPLGECQFKQTGYVQKPSKVGKYNGDP